MRYKNIAGRFFELVTKHACDRQTDGWTDGRDSQDRASIAASRGKNWEMQQHKQKQTTNEHKAVNKRRELCKRSAIKNKILEMWANAQPDGRPAEYRWRPLFNATKFG